MPDTQVSFSQGHCQHCDKKIARRPRGNTPKFFCSAVCRRDALRVPSPDEQYAAFVPAPHPQGCHEWNHSVNAKGYGRIWTNTRKGLSVYAHRYVWEKRNGPIPEGMCVCHRCDNPPCCNIDHLFLGTKADNAHDMYEKGRAVVARNLKPAIGERNGLAKMTGDKVREIRTLYATGDWSHDRLAERFNISPTAVRKIITRKTWLHIT